MIEDCFETLITICEIYISLFFFWSPRRISKNTAHSVLRATPCNEHFVLTLDDLMMNFTWAISITVAIWSSWGFEMKAFAVDRRNFECLIWIICHNLIGALSLCCEKMTDEISWRIEKLFVQCPILLILARPKNINIIPAHLSYWEAMIYSMVLYCEGNLFILNI